MSAHFAFKSTYEADTSGHSACLFGVFRLVDNVRFSRTADVTWDLTPIALWT